MAGAATVVEIPQREQRETSRLAKKPSLALRAQLRQASKLFLQEGFELSEMEELMRAYAEDTAHYGKDLATPMLRTQGQAAKKLGISRVTFNKNWRRSRQLVNGEAQ